MRISLVGTYHAECGAVTIAALLEILKRIEPEVVFAEVGPESIDRWRDGTHGTLESIAVARYAATNLIDVVPVDLPKPESSFFREWEEVSRAIERTSPAYRRLVDLNTTRIRLEGFAYLNSVDCIEAWSNIYREERETLAYIRNAHLSDIFANVHDVIEKRDREMLESIRLYCTSTARACGAFLVGASHRKSLMEKIRAAGEVTTPRIEWDLNGNRAGLR